jgi:hypothetical protein
MPIDFLAHFPSKWTPDPGQVEVLNHLSENWSKFDVFVMQCPTAFGKSALAKTIMDACGSVSYINPTNQLVDQFRNHFPETPTFSRLDSYYCEDWRRSCSATRGKLGKFCPGCVCGKEMSVAKYRKGPGVYNYHIYCAQKLYREVLVADEAHNALRFIQERNAVRLFQHDLRYPSTARSNQQLLDWARSLPPNKRKLKKVALLLSALTAKEPTHIVNRTRAEFNGKGTVRGFPEMRDCIELIPADIRKAIPLLWPSEVKKIVLLSATINQRDIEDLGLGNRRVLYIECSSPIDPERRSVYLDSITPVTHENLEEATKKIAEYLDTELLPYYSGVKGIVHATYEMSLLLKKYLRSPRFMFHDSQNKSDVFEEFLSTPPESARVLIACGMSEGIDLPGDKGRFQAIAKVPWPSLENPAIAYRAEKDQDYYLWETLRTLIQMCGRICRGKNDFGYTHVLDSTALRLIQESKHLQPTYFREALQGNLPS